MNVADWHSYENQTIHVKSHDGKFYETGDANSEAIEIVGKRFHGMISTQSQQLTHQQVKLGCL